MPAGTQLLIVNTFNHRDREDVQVRRPLRPRQWLSGDAAGDWQFNHFSHGPQGCPGTALAMLVGRELLAAVLSSREVKLLGPALDPSKPLPAALDYFALRFELGART